MELTWGQVTDITVGATTVRFVGDSVDTPVAYQAEGLTLATSDIVALGKLGSTDGWVILAILEAT